MSAVPIVFQSGIASSGSCGCASSLGAEAAEARDGLLEALAHVGVERDRAEIGRDRDAHAAEVARLARGRH